MARPRVFRNLFKNRDEEDDDRPVVKFNKNDLFGGQDNKTLDLQKAWMIFNKYGFSKKSAKMTKNLNAELKAKFSLSDVEYLLLVPFMSKTRMVFSAEQINKIARGNEQTFIHILGGLFSFFKKDMLQILPAEGSIEFSMSGALIEYLSTGEFTPKKSNTLKTVIYELDTIANLYNAYKPIYLIGELEIINLLNKNSDYPYCQELIKIYNYCMASNQKFYQFVFYMLGHLSLNNMEVDSMGKDNNLVESFLKFDSYRESYVDDLFKNDDHYLFKNKIFDRAIDETGKADKDTIEIHADFKRKCLQGIIKERRHDDLIKTDKISEKKMFYNIKNQEQIDDLSKMLELDNFNDIKQRLKDSGARTGFACLFSGYPGTGKTETALQIAKKTGRNLIKVDMSSLRSKWWGEDEKNVKAIFSNYEAVLKDSKIEPILLLNEADAIIGKRLDVTGNNGAIISSINAVQNIILEELENFEGILIATTNMTQNMDSAFERRFLYKIEFEKPNLENRANLWMSVFNISEEDARILAQRFDFTGANIENVYRKKTAKSILYGDQYSLDKLIEFCKEEKIEKEKTLGFGT